eukprot:scaffold14.g1293.t1
MKAAVRTERNYRQLLAFLAFVVCYLGSAYRAGEVTATLRALLLPDGGSSVTFQSNEGEVELRSWVALPCAEVLDYVEQRLVAPFWTDPPCSDGECTPPLEFPAWGRFGCRRAARQAERVWADCGAEPNTSKILVKVSWNFGGHPLLAPGLLMTLASWNFCLERGDGDLCWFEQDQTFGEVAATRLEAMEVAGGDWYVVVNGDHAGRVSGGIYSLADAENPAPLPLSPTWEGCKLPQRSWFAAAAAVAEAAIRHRSMKARPRSPRHAAAGRKWAQLAFVTAVSLWLLLSARGSARPSQGWYRLRLRVTTTTTYTGDAPSAGTSGPARLRSAFAPWVRHDFLLWKASGITQEMVDAAASMHWSYHVSSIRFQVINGVLWAVFPKHSRYYRHARQAPALHGCGRRRAAGPRISHTRSSPSLTCCTTTQAGGTRAGARQRRPVHLPRAQDTDSHKSQMLLRMLACTCWLARAGEVPDVDFAWHQGDAPLVGKTPGHENIIYQWSRPNRTGASHVGGVPVPVLSWSGHADFADIPAPDFTFFGHEMDSAAINDERGKWVWDWDHQLAHLSAKYRRPLLEKQPQALQAAGRNSDAELINAWWPRPLGLTAMCDWRFPVYLESEAYSSTLKQKMACGGYHEWFSRALQPGVHYVDVATGKPGVFCEDMVAKVRALNAAVDGGGVLGAAHGGGAPNASATAGGGAGDAGRGGRGAGGETWEEWEWARDEAGDGSDAAGSSTSTIARPRRMHDWSASFTPQEIEQNALQASAWRGRCRFLKTRVTLAQARLYMLDILTTYASLQRFAPAPHRKAVCVTGALLLDMFGAYYKKDRDWVAKKYPWLERWDPGCPPGSQGAWQWRGGEESAREVQDAVAAAREEQLGAAGQHAWEEQRPVQLEQQESEEQQAQPEQQQQVAAAGELSQDRAEAH